MTREQMCKLKWKAYESIDVMLEGHFVACMLLSINFDTEIVTAKPFDTDFYEEDEVQVRIKHIRKSYPKLKVAK